MAAAVLEGAGSCRCLGQHRARDLVGAVAISGVVFTAQTPRISWPLHPRRHPPVCDEPLQVAIVPHDEASHHDICGSHTLPATYFGFKVQSVQARTQCSPQTALECNQSGWPSRLLLCWRQRWFHIYNRLWVVFGIGYVNLLTYDVVSHNITVYFVSWYISTRYCNNVYIIYSIWMSEVIFQISTNS